MTFNGFTEKDFDVFSIDGLEQRMDALKVNIRPKLEELGQNFAPTLSSLTGDEMFYHVAKHARRTINPPKDTWVAFSNSKRGYKQLPHFQIGLWGSHLFIWFAVIYESPIKATFGRTLEANLNTLRKDIPSSFVWSDDHMKPDVKSNDKMSESELTALFKRVQEVKKAEILCGINLTRQETVEMDGTTLEAKIDTTFKQLIPLYKLAQESL